MAHGATIEIPSEDLQWEVWPPRQTGGQQVGTGPRGVKVTHIPSGLVAIADIGHSQHRNRSVALDMLMGGLTSPHFR